MDEEIRKEFDKVWERIKSLEGEKIHKPKKILQNKSLKGIQAGVQEMIEEGFFDTLKTVNEAKEELERKGHFGSKPRVDTTIRRDFFKRRKVLSRRKEGKNWKYSKIK